MKFRIPEGLDLQLLIRKKGKKWAHLDKPVHIDKMIWFVSILTKPKKKRSNSKHCYRYNRVLSKRLEKVLTTRFKPEIIKAIQDIGVMDAPTRGYKNGEYPKGYRLCAKWRRGAVKEVEINDKKLVKRHLDWNENWEYENFQLHLGRKMIVNSLANIVYDSDVGERAISSAEKGKQKGMRDSLQKFLNNRGWRRLTSTKRLNHYWAFMDSPLCSAFYSPDGEDLYEADIKSSQPTLSASFYPKDCAEKEKYISVIQGEGFYELILQQVITGKGLEKTDRPTLKDATFKAIFFGHEKSILNPLESQVRKVFRKEFPELSNIFKKLKWKGYRYLAVLLQQLEAKIVIDDVAYRFAEKYPNACLISKHDSLITTKEYIDEIQQMIEEGIRAECGFLPAVKVAKLSADRHIEYAAAA